MYVCVYVPIRREEDDHAIRHDSAHLDEHVYTHSYVCMYVCVYVPIRREEDDHAIGHDRTHLDEQPAVVDDDGAITPVLEARIQRHLVASSGHYHGAYTLAGERHLKCLGHGHKVEYLGVQIDRTQRARGDDDALKVVKNWLDCQRRVQACEVEQRVGHVGEALVKRLDDDFEALRVAGYEGAKVDDD